MFDTTLLGNICTGDNVLWAGSCPPLGRLKASSRLFDPAHDFRQLPSDHGLYSAVYLIEHDLGQHKQWPLILDEALRLLRYGQRGALFLRFTQSQFLTIFALAAFLRRRQDFSFELIYQDQHPDGTIVYALHCQRESLVPTLSTFEFALITDGQRLDKVARFINSVHRIRGIGHIDSSVALCGPRNLKDALALSGTLLDRVRFIEEPEQHPNKAWITRKKNLIVATSTAENLLIAHDRYELPSSFLEQMFEFGADFSVIAPVQTDLAGQRCPDWVTLGSQWSWTPGGLLQYGDYSPHLYISGGAIISKRRVLVDIPWSELLFWNQAEDIELSRSMTNKGITPRLAQNVSLRVTDSRPGYRHGFARLPRLAHAYAVATPHATDCLVGLAPAQLGEVVDLRQRSLLQGQDLGIVAEDSAWRSGTAGWTPLRSQAELSINLALSAHPALDLQVHVPRHVDTASIQISANETPLRLHWEVVPGTHCATASLEALSSCPSQVTLAVTAPPATAITSIGIVQQKTAGHGLPTTHYPIRLSHGAHILGQGWSAPETFGAWTCANEAVLRLPLSEDRVGRNLKLTLTVIAYGPPKSRRQWVGVTVEGMAVALLEVKPHKKPVRRSIHVPRALIKNPAFLRVSLSPHAPVSPAELGQSDDTRRLGIGLISVDLKPGW